MSVNFRAKRSLSKSHVAGGSFITHLTLSRWADCGRDDRVWSSVPSRCVCPFRPSMMGRRRERASRNAHRVPQRQTAVL